MDAAKVRELKQFIEQCKSNPPILTDPSLSFFRDYLERSLFHLFSLYFYLFIYYLFVHFHFVLSSTEFIFFKLCFSLNADLPPSAYKQGERKSVLLLLILLIYYADLWCYVVIIVMLTNFAAYCFVLTCFVPSLFHN